LGFNKSHIIKE